MNRSILRRSVLAAFAALAAAPAAFGQVIYQIKFNGPLPAMWKERKKIAIPMYEIAFITSQQGNAVASIGARTTLNTMVANPDYGMMKRLTNEGYADLRAKLTAAGIELIGEAETKAAVAPLAEYLANNLDVKVAGGGITVGQSVKIGWAAFGADGAPILKIFHAPAGNPIGGMAAITGTGKIGQAGKALGAVLLMPQLTIDYVAMSTATSNNGRNASANVGGSLQFSLKAPSFALFIVPQDKGAAYSAPYRIDKDAASTMAFATVATGQNFGDTRTDTVTINGPIWETLVRGAVADYNAALVAAIVKSRA